MAETKKEEMVSFIKPEAPVAEVKNEEVKKEETPETEPFVFTREEEAPVAKVEEPKQVTFEFEISNNSNVSIDEAMQITAFNEEPVSNNQSPVIESKDESSVIAKAEGDEQLRKAQERVAKLKELSFKLKSPNGLSELENEPAYKRRNINLSATPHSSESQVSRYTLSEGDDKKVEIKPNNSFLHDNVD